MTIRRSGDQRHRKPLGPRAVRATAHHVGVVVVLGVVLPEADRADLEPAALAERVASAAGTPQGQIRRLMVEPGCVLSEPREPAVVLIGGRDVFRGFTHRCASVGRTPC